MKMTTLDYVTWILVVVGALNWGLIGAFNYNLVGMLFGAGMITSWVYILVGLSGLYVVYKMSTMKKK